MTFKVVLLAWNITLSVADGFRVFHKNKTKSVIGNLIRNQFIKLDAGIILHKNPLDSTTTQKPLEQISYHKKSKRFCYKFENKSSNITDDSRRVLK